MATAALAVVLQTQGYTVSMAKPVQTGEPVGSGDASTVSELAGINTHEFLRFPEPLAPNLAARRAGLPQASRQQCTEWVRRLPGADDPNHVILVEGAGGLLVRLGDHFTLADLAADLEAPMVVVTSLGLGSLNLVELTVGELQRRKVDVAGLVGGSLAPDPDLATRLNLDEMVRLTGVPLWGCLPAGMGELTPADFTVQAKSSLNLRDAFGGSRLL